MKTLFKSVIVSFLVGLCAIPAPAKAQRTTAFQAVSMALQKKDMPSFYRILNRGYNLDSVDESGMGHVCYAIIHKDFKAYKLLEISGANMNPQCLRRIPPQDIKTFLDAGYAQQAETYQMFYGTTAVDTTVKAASLSTPAWVGIGVGAAAVVGGGLALGGGGGGGGGSSAPVNNCTPGTYFDGLTCITCSGDTYSDALATTCQSCPTNARAFADHSGCLCDGYRIWDRATNTCTPVSCQAGQYFQTGVGCTDCPNGYYSTGHTAACTPCINGSVSNDTHTGCICSAEGYSWQTNNTCLATDERACPAGTYWDGSKCTSCPAGTISPARSLGIESCTPCSAGSYSQSGDATCTLCEAGTFSNAGDATCTSCRAGTYSLSGAETCTSCEAGTESSEGASACTPCTAGTAGTGTCTACTAGTYAGMGQATCSTCPAGQISADNAETCIPCRAGSVPNAAATACESCPVGTHALVDGMADCTPCAAGTYNDTVGSANCTPCAIGTYSDAGSTSCETCPVNSGTISSGATGIEACICDAGYYGSSGNCIACGDGSTSERGASACTCSEGFTWQSNTNSCKPTSASACRAGTYWTGSFCENCPNGQSSEDGADGIGECFMCPAGTHSVPGSTCTPCEAGTYSNAGSISCRVCPDGQYSNAGAPSCMNCRAGTYGKDGVCVPCNEGFFSASEGSAECTPCAAGEYTNLKGQTQCLDCDKGSYSVGGSNVCTLCPENSTTSATGSISEEACVCDIGFYGTSQSGCTACPANSSTLNIGSTTAASCVCAQNYYGTNGTCTKCPEYSTSPVGSDSMDDCQCNSGFKMLNGVCIRENLVGRIYVNGEDMGKLVYTIPEGTTIAVTQSGTVGMAAFGGTQDDVIATNKGTIDMGTVPAFGITATGVNATATNDTTGTIRNDSTSIQALGMATTNGASIENKGTINLRSTGTGGTSVGMTADSDTGTASTAINNGSITISQTGGSSDLIGMSASSTSQDISSGAQNNGTITLNYQATSIDGGNQVIGLKSDANSLIGNGTNGVIRITNAGMGSTIGIKTENDCTNLVNAGSLTLTGTLAETGENSRTVGIEADVLGLNNSGTITITSASDTTITGIWAKDNASSVSNTAAVTVTHTEDEAETIRGIWTENTAGTLSNTADITLTTDSLAEIVGIKTSATTITDNGKISVTRNNVFVSDNAVHGLYADNTESSLTRRNGRISVNSGLVQDAFVTGIYTLGSDVRILDTEEDTETEAEISVSANTATSATSTVAGIYTTNVYAGILNQADMDISLLGTGTGYGIYSVGANASTGNAVSNSGHIDLSRRYSGTTSNNLVAIWAENQNGVLSNSGKIDVSSDTTVIGTTPLYVSGIYFGGKQLTNTLYGITVSSAGEALTSGIWHENTAANATSVLNEAPITVTNNGPNETYGIYSKSSNPNTVFSLTNSGDITVNRTNTEASTSDISGIKMDNKTGVLTNTGDINVFSGPVNKDGTIIHYVTGLFSSGTTLVNGEEEDTDSEYEIVVAMNATGSATLAGIYNMENELLDDTEDTDTEEASVLNYGDIHIVTNSTGTTYGIYGDVETVTNNGKIFIESTNSSVVGIDGWRKAKTITNNGQIIVNNTGNGSVVGISAMHEKNQIFNTGAMNLTSDGTGWMYGAYTNGIHINNTADINITRNNATESTNSIYGLWLDNKPPLVEEGTIINTGNITIFSNSTSSSGIGGVYNTYEGAVINDETGKINITLNGSGNATVYGIHSPGEILNRATIDIDHNGGTGNVYGIDGFSLEITNYGNISIKANGAPDYYFGISNEEGKIINNAPIQIVRTLLGTESAGTSMYGIYGEEGVITSNDPQTVSSTADIYLYSNGLDAMYGIYGNAEPEGDYSLFNGASIGLVRENGLLEATNNMVGIWANNPNGIVINDVLGSISLTATSMNSLATETDTTVMAGILSYAMETTNRARIDIGLGSGTADIYGIYTDNESTESTLLNTGLAITITTGGSGRAYGIFSGVAESVNEGAINITSSASADIFGISSEDLKSVINNAGVINLTQTGRDLEGTAYGIHSTHNTTVINNEGAITITSSGIGILSGIDTEGAEVYNEGDITVTRTSSASSSAVHGIRVDNSSGNVTNRANITLSSPANTGILAGIWSTGLETTHGQTGGEEVAIKITQNDVSASDIYGIYAQNNNTAVTNNQLIDITSAGTASSYHGGIWIDGTNAYALNNGTISINENSDSIGNMFGIWSVAGGVIENAGPTETDTAGQINLEGSGSGTLYGIKGTATEITNKGNIVSQNYAGTGTLYGIYADGASNVLNDETGKVSLTGTGTIYGVYLEDATTEMINKGLIKVSNTNLGGQTIYGVYANGATFTNEENAAVDVTNNTTGIAYGIYGMAGSKIINKENSAINVYNNGANGTAIGIYLDGSEFTNSGTLDIKNDGAGTVYGIYATGTSTVRNNGRITLASTGTEIGIYATEGTTVFNTGIIEIGGIQADLETDETEGEVLEEEPPFVVLNGEAITFPTTATTTSTAIVLENGATLVNAGTLSAEGTLDLDEFGKGATVLSKGGIVSAQRIKGTLVAGSSLVSEGNETVYTAENVLQSDDISGLNLTSGSALFDAKKDGNDVVMTMKEFSDVYGSGELASFMQTNYTDGLGIDMFQTLKSSETLEELLGTTAKETGASLLPNFAQENFGVYRSLGRAMNNSLFADKGDNRAIVAYDMLYQNRKDKGTLTGYDNYANTVYGLFDRKVTDNLSLGGGLSITHFHSSYDDDSSRNELMFQAFAPITYDLSSSVRFVSMPRIGYSFGDYKRYATNSTHEGDIQNITYGVSNEIRKVIPTGFMDIEPAAEFNILGYRQQKIKESKRDGALILDATNYVSVEGGLGLYASKRIPFENSTLGIRMGGAYYHEFADPYSDIDAGMYQMSGGYTLSGKGLNEGLKNKRDRGLLTAKVSYDWRDWSFYASFTQFIENDTRLNANLGASLKF